MVSLKDVFDLLVGRNEGERAKLAAYVLAPGLVLGIAVPGIYTSGVSLDVGRPVTVSTLLSEVSTDGQVTGRSGLALIMEPMQNDYSIPFDSAVSMWVSLDESAARDNAERLKVTKTGFHSISPLVGVSDPVTIVVQGKPGTEILLAGSKQPLDNWRVQSRRSVSLISGVLLACVFGFGMAIATGFPIAKGKKNAGSKKRTSPDEE